MSNNYSAKRTQIMDMKNMYTPVVIGVVAGLIVGFAAGWYWTTQNYSTNETNESSADTQYMNDSDTENQNSEETTIQSANEELQVVEQDAGDSVVVQAAVLADTSWLAVRELVNGQMGNILGAARVQESGFSENIEIKLLRPTVAGQEYAVVIYKDNGDGDFDFNFDSLIVSGSEPVQALFVVR